MGSVSRSLWLRGRFKQWKKFSKVCVCYVLWLSSIHLKDATIAHHQLHLHEAEPSQTQESPSILTHPATWRDRVVASAMVTKKCQEPMYQVLWQEVDTITKDACVSRRVRSEISWIPLWLHTPSQSCPPRISSSRSLACRRLPTTECFVAIFLVAKGLVA